MPVADALQLDEENQTAMTLFRVIEDEAAVCGEMKSGRAGVSSLSGFGQIKVFGLNGLERRVSDEPACAKDFLLHLSSLSD